MGEQSQLGQKFKYESISATNANEIVADCQTALPGTRLVVHGYERTVGT